MCCVEEVEPKRKSRFYTSRTPERDKERKSSRTLSGTKLRLSHFGLGRKHKKKSTVMEDSLKEQPPTPNYLDVTTSSEDYVRISRSEYEDIKNRVSQIESRISSEFENMIGVSMSDLEMTPDKSGTNNLKTVQSVYEKTLESAEKLNSSGSDELAKRLGKELKIRDSLEKKVMRSPSARKIGSLRRRSRENIPHLKRNLSFNAADRWNARQQFYPLNSLQRGKPNSVYNGLPEPMLTVTGKSGQLSDLTNQLTSELFEYQTFEPSDFDFTSFGVLTRSQARRASSFHGCDLSKNPPVFSPMKHLNKNPPSETTNWKSADIFLKDEKTDEKPVTGRPSIAKIRSQNAGMVLAKTKLFNTMVYMEDRHETRAFKTEKPTTVKSRELKKRNSSKSSKERKLTRSESRNGTQKQNKEQSVLKEPSNTPIKPETCAFPKKDKFNLIVGKENLPQSSVCVVQSPLHKTPLLTSKTAQKSCTPLKQLKPENYRNNSATKRSVNKPVVQGRSPKISRHILDKTAASPSKRSSSTPRKSPRTLMLKSRHINKNI